MQSLQAVVAGANVLNMPASVAGLAAKVANGDPANATVQYLNAQGYVSTSLVGNLYVGSSSFQLQELVDKWFLGDNYPATSSAYSAFPESLASLGNPSTVLFGANQQPSYLDVQQGAAGDCWLLASLAEVADRAPSDIKNMFTFDGTATVNGSLNSSTR